MQATSPRPPVDGRRLTVIAIAAALAGALLMVSFEYANHAPTPHGVRIRVVAPAASAAPRDVARGLAKVAPGGFSVRRTSSEAAARAAIRDQRADGALVLSGAGGTQILTAGAAGPALAQVIDKALTGAAAASGHRAVLQDVAPLPADDRSGASSFELELGLLIPSVLGSVGLYLVGLRARVWWRVAAAALFSLLVAGLGLVVIDADFGALSGAAPAVFGIAAFGALSFVLAIAACQASFGLVGTAIAALVFIFLGNAVSSGTTPAALLPDVYRDISPWLPNGAVVRGVRDVVYFNGSRLGQPLLALSLWSGAALALIAVNDLLHLAECRRAPERAADIYATSGIRHTVNRRRRRAPQTRSSSVLPVE